MMTALKLLSNAWGRGYATVELASIIKTLREGLSIPMARIGDLIVGSAKIASLSADKITSGTIQVTTSITIDGEFNTGTVGAANVHIIPDGIEGYNSGGTQKFELNTDGSGWLGASGSFSWDTNGVVSIDGAALQALSVENAAINECSINKLTAGNLSVKGTIVAGGSLVTGLAGTNRIEITNTTISGINSSNVTQFYLSASDGKAYAGAGTITLDSTGLKVKGQVAEFQDSAGAARGYIYGTNGPAFVIAGEASTEIHLVPGGLGTIYSYGSILPASDITHFLGYDFYRWLGVYGNPVLDDGSKTGENIQGALSRSGGADGVLYVYVNGVWRLNNV